LFAPRDEDFSGSAADLAEKIRTAVSTPGLWDRLQDGIPHVYGMDEHVSSLLIRIYDKLSAGRALPSPEASALAQQAG
jgi:hypothetical protein